METDTQPVYDSRPATLQHIRLVQKNLKGFTDVIKKRTSNLPQNEAKLCSILEHMSYVLHTKGRIHDQSKLEAPEKEVFDALTPRLQKTTYGSKAYERCLKDLQVALKHHYCANTHHPEYFTDGINGMTLLDVIEMLADWAAATERHDDGNIHNSLQINKKRFNIEDPLVAVLQNTVRGLKIGRSVDDGTAYRIMINMTDPSDHHQGVQGMCLSTLLEHFIRLSRCTVPQQKKMLDMLGPQLAAIYRNTAATYF
jgi:hypothetical protein